MKQFGRIRRTAAILGGLVFGAGPALLMPGSAMAGVVSLSSSASSVAVGESFTLSLRIDGLTGAVADSLAGFDLKLGFDAGAVQLSGHGFVDAGSGLNPLDLPEVGGFGFNGDASLVAGGGAVSAFGLSGNSGALLDSDQADAFVFLTLRFLALADSPAAQFSLDLGDPGLLFADSGSDALAVSFRNTALTVSIGPNNGVVPEPSSLGLAGLALLACLGRRRGAIAASTAMLVLSPLAFAADAPAAPKAAVQAAGSKVDTQAGAVDGLVVEVRGQRLKVRGADGHEAWFTTSAPLSSEIVNKRVRGQAKPAGDSQLLDAPKFD
ncbi:PEP-CTERM sorting domain-containing protein [Roseateles sp.]|uniref:PEP-CTERM sorting domain-containing protein n=1 Tax=Roseateles sp. TaxID=1971397 RepID=UPI00286A2916|nr:PEP-CTERM sorting domain-containing protein [Roseateles sp.]